MPRHSNRLIIPVLSFSLLAGLFGATLVTHAAGGRLGPPSAPCYSYNAWTIVPSPNVPGARQYDELMSVTAINRSDIWAVGKVDSAVTLIEHYNGAAWTIVPSPNVSNSSDDLVAVSADTTSDVWAVGSSTPNTSPYPVATLIEHWDGAQWSIVPSPNVSSRTNTLSGVVALSSVNVWAVGYCFDDASELDQTLVEHWDGSAWSVVPSPNAPSSTTSPENSLLNGVTAVSPSDVWAVGNYFHGASYTLVEHWDGRSWSIVPSPNWEPDYVSQDSLTRVAAGAYGSLMAVGIYDVSPPDQMIAEEWDGTTWTLVPTPNHPADMVGVTAVPGSRHFWSVGHYIDASSNTLKTLTVYWDGTIWHVIPSPNQPSIDWNQLLGVTSLTEQDVWAVGYYFSNTTTTDQTLILHYHSLPIGRPCALGGSPSQGGRPGQPRTH